jgi:DNA-nicking Smr family endonuclease
MYMSYYPPKEEHFEPDIELDLHGCTTVEAKEMLDEVVESGVYTSARIIVGKGTRSEFGPVLPVFVHNYLKERKITYKHAPLREGGSGVYDVTL